MRARFSELSHGPGTRPERDGDLVVATSLDGLQNDRVTLAQGQRADRREHGAQLGTLFGLIVDLDRLEVL